MQRSRIQFERLRALDERIRAGKYPNRHSFAAEWEVSVKTVQRDINFMRDRLGAPIEFDLEQNGYFYAEPSWFLPSLPLKEGDLFSLLVARQAVEQYKGTPIARKLEQIYDQIADALQDRTEVRPDEIPTDFSFVHPPALPVDEAIWQALCRALLDRCSVRIRYQSRSAQEPKMRVFDPFHMANIQGDWYVFGRREDYPDRVLQLAVGRVQSVERTELRFKVPRSFVAQEWMENTFGRYASMERPVQVRVRLSGPAAYEAELRRWHPRQKTVRRRNGAVEVSFPVSAGGRMPFYHVAEWVLGFGRHARVLAPVGLKRRVAEEIRAMAKALESA